MMIALEDASAQATLSIHLKFRLQLCKISAVLCAEFLEDIREKKE
jgi:hypothetical protein